MLPHFILFYLVISGDCLLCLQSLAVCFSKCEEFSLKQAECGKLLDTVEQFVTLSKISGSALVEKLCLPAIDCLTDDLKKARCVCSKTPMLLIAG